VIALRLSRFFPNWLRAYLTLGLVVLGVIAYFEGWIPRPLEDILHLAVALFWIFFIFHPGAILAGNPDTAKSLDKKAHAKDGY
jgi:hypothetical protein